MNETAQKKQNPNQKQNQNQVLQTSSQDGSILSYVVVFLLGCFLGATVFWVVVSLTDFMQRSEKSTTTTPVQETVTEKTATEEEKARVYALDKEVSVYLVWWDQDNGFETIKQQKEKIYTVHPFWYQMKADGSIVKFSGAENEEVIEFCKENEIKIIPVITNEHDPEPVETVLRNDALKSEHISNILSIIEKNKYDGIEIDYESLEAEDRAIYSSFMTTLAEKVHAKEKLLTAAVHAKTSDEGTWGGPAAQDWSVLNSVCDSVKVMTYDYHWSTSEAGDIAPLSWMREVYDYAVTVIDPSKIHIGIHFYGYDWVGEQAQDLTYSDVEELLSKLGQPVVSTSLESEKYFGYEKDGENHTVYFADHETVEARVNLVDEYNVAGIGIWRVGQEDSESWEVIGGEFM